MFSIHISL